METKFLKIKSSTSQKGKKTFWGLFESKFNTQKGIKPFWTRLSKKEFIDLCINSDIEIIL